jgi:hypothetical protein
MERVIFSFLLAVISFSNFCCNSQASPPPVDPSTKKFSAYLKANFDDTIPAARHLYFLIAKNDSRENISVILARLKEELKAMPKDHYTMVFSVNMPVADSLIPKGNSHTDWNGALEKLEMNLAGVTILQTVDHKVVDQLRLDKDVFGMERKFLNW